MILTNCTESRRGLMLKDGIRFLEGREMWTVPVEKEAEIRALFQAETFQRFVDNGVFRLSEMKEGEESVAVKTPQPPASLVESPRVEGLGNAVSTHTGSRAVSPTVVEHQSGGVLPLRSSDASMLPEASSGNASASLQSALQRASADGFKEAGQRGEPGTTPGEPNIRAKKTPAGERAGNRASRRSDVSVSASEPNISAKKTKAKA